MNTSGNLAIEELITMGFGLELTCENVVVANRVGILGLLRYGVVKKIETDSPSIIEMVISSPVFATSVQKR